MMICAMDAVIAHGCPEEIPKGAVEPDRKRPHQPQCKQRDPTGPGAPGHATELPQPNLRLPVDTQRVPLVQGPQHIHSRNLIYVYIFIYICIFAYPYVCISVCVYMYIHIYVYDRYLQIYMCVADIPWRRLKATRRRGRSRPPQKALALSQSVAPVSVSSAKAQ